MLRVIFSSPGLLDINTNIRMPMADPGYGRTPHRSFYYFFNKKEDFARIAAIIDLSI